MTEAMINTINNMQSATVPEPVASPQFATAINQAPFGGMSSVAIPPVFSVAGTPYPIGATPPTPTYPPNSIIVTDANGNPTQLDSNLGGVIGSINDLISIEQELAPFLVAVKSKNLFAILSGLAALPTEYQRLITDLTAIKKAI